MQTNPTKAEMEQPLVSVIVRTCQRPEVLQNALNSIGKQTYPNIQIVIVEDGENSSEQFVRNNYSHLNYIYEATGEKQGRSHAGNRGLSLAAGEYFNFLDDDDLLGPEHIKTLVDAVKDSSCQAAYSVAQECQVMKEESSRNIYKVKRKTIRYNQPYNKLLLCTFNYLPIQSVLFHRSLYDQHGGFDEQLEALEDWDLWVRYSLSTDFLYVNRVTSFYHVPYKKKVKETRSADMRDYLQVLYEKFNTYGMTLNVKNVNTEMTYVIREYKNKGLLMYIRRFCRILLLGER